jgi:hypothetical protein
VKLLVPIVIALLVLISFAVILRLATPESWPLTPGTLKATKIKISGQDFIIVEGEGINKLGQIQSIDVSFDDTRKKIIVNRSLIRWNPFTKIAVNNQWPVLYSLDSLKPGKYSVVYKTTEGEATAGSFDVP